FESSESELHPGGDVTPRSKPFEHRYHSCGFSVCDKSAYHSSTPSRRNSSEIEPSLRHLLCRESENTVLVLAFWLPLEEGKMKAICADAPVYAVAVFLLLVASFLLVCRWLWRKGSRWIPPCLNW